MSHKISKEFAAKLESCNSSDDLLALSKSASPDELVAILSASGQLKHGKIDVSKLKFGDAGGTVEVEENKKMSLIQRLLAEQEQKIAEAKVMADAAVDKKPARSDDDSLPPMSKSLEAYNETVSAAGRRISKKSEELQNTITVYKAYDRNGKVYAWYKEPATKKKAKKD